METILTALANGVASTTSGVGSAMATNLPAIFAIFGALIAIGLVVRYIKKLIGRK